MLTKLRTPESGGSTHIHIWSSQPQEPSTIKKHGAFLKHFSRVTTPHSQGQAFHQLKQYFVIFAFNVLKGTIQM